MFLYTVLKETEKASYIKVPYWKPTDMSQKSHKQLYYETWVPKAVITKGEEDLKAFVIYTKANKREANGWTKGKKLPNFWKSLGQMAPKKEIKTRKVLDYDKYMEMVNKYHSKYNTKEIRRLYHNPDDFNVSEEDYNIIEQMMIHSYGIRECVDIPYKEETYWQ